MRVVQAGSLIASAAFILAGVAAIVLAGEPASTEKAPADQAIVEKAAEKAVVEAPTVHKTDLGSAKMEAARYDSVDYNQRGRLLARGKAAYDIYCIGCHGEHGDGRGPAAERLITKPRDFTSGVYKFRSTDSSSLPLESDLHRTITRGLAQVSMPGFPLMPEHEKVAVIAYIKSFYPRWDEEAGKRKVIAVPRAPIDLETPERIARGQITYVTMQCGKCHGSNGAGKGATATSYKDAWGNDQKPFNFTRGRLKGGDDPEDIFRTFHTGLRSIMPSYGGTTLALAHAAAFKEATADMPKAEQDALAPALEEFPKDFESINKLSDIEKIELAERNSWDLVAYILSLRKASRPAAQASATAASAEK